VEIRALTESDAGAFWRLRLRALREHPEAFGMAYEEARDRPLADVTSDFRTRYTGVDSVILGAFDGELVGLAGCFRHEGTKRRHKALVWGMYVAPEARGRGIGRALLAGVIAQARAWPGVEQLQLGVMTENEAARALYRSMGFEVFGLERRSLRVGPRDLDEEHMVLDLGVERRP
jgi:ribosomal protein S18 acetylase RimI-like enzyme